MKSKRYLLLLGIICLILSFNIPHLYADQKFPLSGWPKGIICGGGTPGSAYYTLMVGVSELSTKYLKVKGTVISTAAGSGVGIRGMSKGELDFTSIVDMTAYWACKGIGPYKGKIVKNVRAVAGNNPVLFCLVTDAKYGIKTMKDLKGSGYPISIHVKGSAAFSSAADSILEFYGLGPNDVKPIPHVSKAEAVSGLKEGRFKLVSEAGYATQAMPYWMELDRDIDMRMISLSQECIAYVQKKVPGFVPGVMPAGLYKGVKEKIDTVGIASGVYCRAEVPDTFVYELCKLIFESPTRAEWEKLAAHHKLITKEKAKDFLTPVHAGAVKYYKEKGVWTDEMEKHRKGMLAELGMKE